ncbi:MAG: NADH-quinone oxidoreductase subunit L [Deltaproteobacteria bacterium]|nr:NADH-quinone oxidoreductase subunit L [Deltaproteobacteria bacterium]
MKSLLWLIPALPLAGFAVLLFSGSRLSNRLAGLIGTASVGLSAIISLLIAIDFISEPPVGNAYTQVLWRWLFIGGFSPEVALRLDALSLTMIMVITVVAFLIHLYSTEFMAEDEGYRRFFSYMNLFVGSMSVLVLADNMLLLYLGWEGVGLCSYLLIGFWYSDSYNGYAARKAFIVTRIGDTALIIGIFLLFTSLGTLQIQELIARASLMWPVNSALAIAASALLLGGALGKSAQLPLQTWLPDAMAGPTPVSALIHAATMVTAGVYLIARTHALFDLAPSIKMLVAVIGAATLLISAFSALAQSDIKRILAYSTISQIGYMFLALGVGAWSSAIFHFMTHAFFKALLFLGAGAVILSLDHEHNIFKMGGLKKELPFTFYVFFAGAASLSALPLVTAGYYSKDLILHDAFTSPSGSPLLWAVGILGAFLTALYTFRLLFIVFFGEPKTEVTSKPGLKIKLPLFVLAVFSITAGFVETTSSLGDIHILSGFLVSSLPPLTKPAEPNASQIEIAGAFAPLAGILIAYLIYYRNPGISESLAGLRFGNTLKSFWFSGWGFDNFYDRFFVRPLFWIVMANRNDFLDKPFLGIASTLKGVNRLLALSQSGKVRWYAFAITMGAVLALCAVILP